MIVIILFHDLVNNYLKQNITFFLKFRNATKMFEIVEYFEIVIESENKNERKDANILLFS